MGYTKPLEPGIYQIRNKINNKIYIGSAVRLKKRANYHKLDAQKGKAVNRRLLASIKHHGWENFVFEILERISSEIYSKVERKELNILLNEREQYWVDLLDPEYNIRKIDVSRPVEEVIKRLSSRSKRVAVFYQDGTYIETCPSVCSTWKKYKVVPFQIERIANCKACGPSRGLIFKWEKEMDQEITFVKPAIIDKTLSSTKVYQCTQEGVLINEWKCMKDAREALGISNGTLKRLLIGYISKKPTKRLKYLNQFIFKAEFRHG